MVIYGDILFILNMTVDYLLIGITSTVLKRKVGALRQIIASVIGGIASFYIFVDSESILIDIIFKLFVSYLMMLVMFGIKPQKRIFTATAVFLLLSLLLSGVSGFVADTFALDMLRVNNGYVYIGIPPILLIILSVIFYFLLKIIFRINKNRIVCENCEVIIEINKKKECFCALIDSGNMLTDALSDSEIFIVSEKAIRSLCGMPITEYFEASENKKRCRIIPTSTVNGEGCLYGVRCDKAILSFNNQKYDIIRPIAVFSKNVGKDGYDVIIPKGATEAI